MTETMTVDEYKKEVAKEKRERLERLLLGQIKQADIPTPEWQYKGLYNYPGLRNKPWDLAWPAAKLLVEVNGGEWTQGRHARGQGMIDDYAKWNAATLLGWRVLLFAGTQVKNGIAVKVIHQALVEFDI